VVAPRVSLAVDDAELLASFAAIRAELHITTGFDDATQSEADTVARRGPIVPAGSTALAIADRREIAFVTIDPQGSRDLDQAYAAQRTARGYRVWYAIADVASFIDPDSPLDHAARARGATIFAPDERAPLHPVVINEGAASLLPGVDRQAALWTIEIDEHGAVLEARVERATVRSRQQLSYPQAQHLVDAKEADESLALLARIGSARIDQERDRGAVSLSIPAQIVGRADGRFELEYEQSLPIEKWNAQISLMTGMAAARIMIDAGIGLLRTMPAPSRADIAKLRHSAAALDIEWPTAMSYPDRIRTLDPNAPRAAAFMTQAARLSHGAGYLAFRGALPPDHEHSAIAASYAHATAPLRRTADRFVNEIVLSHCAGTAVPEWTSSALDGLPHIMSRAQQRQRKLDRSINDLLEAVTLEPSIGAEFTAGVTDIIDGVARVQLREAAVVADVPVAPDDRIRPGDMVRLRLVAADPAHRSVRFSLEPAH
jgi:exoribonuclease R